MARPVALRNPGQGRELQCGAELCATHHPLFESPRSTGKYGIPSIGTSCLGWSFSPQGWGQPSCALTALVSISAQDGLPDAAQRLSPSPKDTQQLGRCALRGAAGHGGADLQLCSAGRAEHPAWRKGPSLVPQGPARPHAAPTRPAHGVSSGRGHQDADRSEESAQGVPHLPQTVPLRGSPRGWYRDTQL